MNRPVFQSLGHTKSPCQCVPPKRTATCHSICEEYKEWLKTHQEEIDEFRKKNHNQFTLRG